MWFSELAVKYDTQTGEIEFIPTVECGAGIELAKGEEKKRILAEFKERNERLSDGTWYNGWVDFCEENREVYTRTVINVGAVGEDKHFERFAHYLDCEAHRDVWQELFKTHNYRNEVEK